MNGTETIVGDLRRSSEHIGKLYPVLVDSNDNVIDGHHRLAANANWPKVKLEHIHSEKDVILARLISNVCRRRMPREEKEEILKNLAKIFLKEGEKLGRIPHRISEETGMSYRWVMKYLPSHLKHKGNFPGPSKLRWIDEPTRARRPILSLDKLVSQPIQNYVVVKSYTNTNFVNFTLEKQLYERLEQACRRLRIQVDCVINNAILLAMKEIETVSGTELASAIEAS
jgi:hypothetical protein